MKPYLCLFAASILTIGQGCCDSKEIPNLDRNLYSGNAKARNDAALALARCGSDASGSVSRLADMLYDENIGVQSSAAYALRKIDTKQARSALDQAEEARRRRRK